MKSMKSKDTAVSTTSPSGDRRLWLAALLLGGALNLVLVGLLPGLLRRAPPPEAWPETRDFRVVRLPEPGSYRVRSHRPAPEKPVRERRVRPRPAVAMPRRPQMPPLELPLEIVPALPAQGETVAVRIPMAERVDLGPPPPEAVLPQIAPAARVYDVAALDRPLVPTVRRPPVYPRRARRRGITGRVTVSFRVTRTGAVEGIEIVDAQPKGVFERSVRRCVAGWRFDPGTVDGRPVDTRVRTTIRFELE